MPENRIFESLMKSLNIIDECVSKVVNMAEIQLLFLQELFASFRVHFDCAILMSALKRKGLL